MIEVEVKDLIKDLENFYLEAVRKMENMVRNFSYEISLTAIENTPLGDSIAYKKLYERRERSMGLKPIEGLAQGGWQYSLDGSLDFQEIYSGATALGAVKSHAMNYKLGDMVIIGNKGPYIGLLEDNHSPQTEGQGIMQPTEDAIMAIQKVSLLTYYKQG